MREFCTLASESRAQTGTLDASNIYYGLPEYFRPGQQDASELFEYFMRTCPLFQTFFTGIETQTQDYSHCRPCNTQSLPFTTRVLHVKDTKHTTGAVSLKQLILDSNAPETAIECQICSQMHRQQVLQTESIASGLVISLVAGLSRRRIHYPSVLNFPVRNAVVELILVGVVRHVGETPMAGHYFAVIQNFEDLSCWICDDSVVTRATEEALLGECKGHPVLMFYIRKEVLEAVRKRKHDSIALEAKRSSDRLRQRARRAGNSKEATEKVHAADAARHQEHRAVLSEAHSQNVRAANTARDRERRAGLPEADLQTARAANTARDRERRAALPEADLQTARAADAARHQEQRAALQDAVLHNVRAANTARDRERRAARLQERRAEDAANDGCAGRTLQDFDAQAKQKIRDFISPSNMGRDTCACCNELNPRRKCMLNHHLVNGSRVYNVS